MSEYTVWWIDDNEDRMADAENLRQGLSDVRVAFHQPDQVIQQLDPNKEDYEELGEIDLVLIDWKLHEQSDFSGKGLTMAGRVREAHPGVPIYGFSSEFEALRTGAGNDQFEALLRVRDLRGQENAELLKADLESFSTIEQQRFEGFESLIDVLNPPSGALEEIRSVVPREYIDGLKGSGKRGDNAVNFANWIRYRFLETPGPLLDDTWAATKIGLTKSMLDGYADDLNNTEHEEITYDGVFSHRKGRRWWNTLLIDAVVALSGDTQLRELNEFGTEVLETENIPICKVCQKKGPEIVAAGRNGRDADSPVHLLCSHVHHTREGAFEDYRISEELEAKKEEDSEPAIELDTESTN